MRTKLVTHGSGYTLIKELTPLDQTCIKEMLGEKYEDTLLLENAVVAQSILWHEFPLENLTEEEYLIPHPTQPDNYIEIEDFEGKKNKNGEYPKKRVLNPDRPHNYIVDRAKVKRVEFKPALNLDELLKRMCIGLADWYVIGQASFKLNEPNPVLLGK